MPTAPAAPPAAATAAPKATPTPEMAMPLATSMPLSASPSMTESFNELRKLVGAEPRPIPKPAEKKAEPTKEKIEELSEKFAPKKEEAKPDDQPKTEDKPVPASKDDAPPESKGLGKVLTHYKKKAVSLEGEITTLKEQLATFQKDPNVVTGLRTELETTKNQLKELQDKLYTYDYTQDPEFKKTYVEPYTASYRRALHTVQELTVTDADGNVRKASEADLIPILQLPLGKAMELAQQTFGDELGRYVVNTHYTEVRRLADAQLDAMEEAKKTGSEKVRQRTESETLLRQENFERWQSINAEDEQKYEFLKPKEGDDEWNAALAKATKFVDEAFGGNPNDPKLPQEQRKSILRKRVATRNRARGFSMMRLEVNRLKAELAKAQKTITGYKVVQPGGGEGQGGGGAPVAGGDTMAGSLAELRKRAR